MSYRDLLDETITEPMPPFESVDDLIARERRALGRRRFAAVGAAAGGVVAVLVAVTAFGGTPTASRPFIGATAEPTTVSPSPKVQPAPTAEPSPTASPVPAPEPDKAALRALTTAVKARLSDLLPNSTFTRNHPGYYPDWPALEVGMDQGDKRLPMGAGYRSLAAMADISGGDGVGSFDILIGRADDGQPRAKWCETTACDSFYDVSGVLDVLTDCDQKAEDDKRACKESTGPHGEGIVTLTGRIGGGGKVEYRVDVTRPDGSALLVMCRNWTRVGGNRGPGGPPLSVADLLEIALDPRLAAPR